MAGPGMDAKSVVKRWDSLRNKQANFRNLWEDVNHLVIPFRMDSNADFETPGERKNQRIFDGTAPWALTVAASAIHGTMTPSTVKWFSVGVDNEQVMARKENRVWFEKARDLMFKAINKSNFSSEGNEAFLDLLAYGTSCLHIAEKDQGGIEDEFRGIKFKAYQPSTIVLSENEDGIADAVYRRSDSTVAQLVSKFGLGNVSPRTQKKWDTGKVDEMCRIIHGTWPRHNVKASEVTLNTKAKDLPYASAWVELDGKHMMKDSGSFMPQYACPRWYKASNEEYGRSPAINSMPDIRSLNRVVELELEALGLAVHPPLLVVDRGVLGTLRMVPNGINSVRDANSITPFQSGARFDVANLSSEKLQAAIIKAFYIDQIQLPPAQGTPVTATEVATRFETMQRVLGPTFGRVQTELMAVVLMRIFWLMARRSAFPAPPEELGRMMEQSPASIDFTFDGPLARAQQASEVESVQRAVAILSPMQPIFPEIMDHFNAKEAGKFVLSALRVPAEVMDSDEEVKAKQEARAEASQQQNDLESGAVVAKGLKDTTPFLEQLNAGG